MIRFFPTINIHLTDSIPVFPCFSTGHPPSGESVGENKSLTVERAGTAAATASSTSSSSNQPAIQQCVSASSRVCEKWKSPPSFWGEKRRRRKIFLLVATQSGKLAIPPSGNSGYRCREKREKLRQAGKICERRFLLSEEFWGPSHCPFCVEKKNSVGASTYGGV